MKILQGDWDTLSAYPDGGAPEIAALLEDCRPQAKASPSFDKRFPDTRRIGQDENWCRHPQERYEPLRGDAEDFYRWFPELRRLQ